MRPSSSVRVLSVLGLLTLWPLASSCALFGNVLSKAPTMEDRAWQQETVLVEPPSSQLGHPSVFLDAQGRAAIALADRAFYAGVQTVALGRRTDAGWRLELPLVGAPWRVCGRAGPGDGVVLATGELEGPLTGHAWDGRTLGDAEPGECPRLAALERELTAGGHAHHIEISGDGRTVWHRIDGAKGCPPHDSTPDLTIKAFDAAVGEDGDPQVLLFESQGDDQGAAGQLRHAVCKDGAWTSSMLASSITVAELGIMVGPQGRPHVAYVSTDAQGVRLTYATPAEGAPALAPARDARVEPALEACARLLDHPPRGEGIEPYQSGDALRCAVLARDAETSTQALTVATERCEGGDASACVVAGSLHHWLMGAVSIAVELPTAAGMRFTTEWRGLRPEGIPEDTTRAAELYGRGCSGGQARGCLDEAVLLPVDDPRRRERGIAGCEAGDVAGCAIVLVAASAQADPELRATVEPTLRAACDGGDAVACNDLGVALSVSGDAAGARAALQRACDAKLDVGCRNLGRAEGR